MSRLDPDTALSAYEQICKDFGRFCAGRGRVSEADTRAKFVDRVLKEVLGWSEDAMRREEPTSAGYLDYSLATNGKRVLLVEAKAEGEAFEFPKRLENRRRQKINGALRTVADVKAALEQVQRYCSDMGVRYAVVTNGYAWLVFRAVRDDMPWRDGTVLVFPSVGYIRSNFVEFWNVLSNDAVTLGSLVQTFATASTDPVPLYRPIDKLHNPDAQLLRNRLHHQLAPFVETVFRDIGASAHIDMMRRCYVYSRSLKIIDRDLRLVIQDTMPRFAKNDGAIEIKAGPNDAGELGGALATDVAAHAGGVLFMLLGGIGSGKTTFLNRFLHVVGQGFLQEKCVWSYINFLAPPSRQDEMEAFVYQTILRDVRERYKALDLESRDALKQIYADDISALDRAFFQAEGLTGTDYEKRLSRFLEKWVSNIPQHTSRILTSVRSRDRTGLIIIDNVDQLSPDYQAKIFLLAQQVARSANCLVIVALREESYYAASTRKAFTAYNNRKFRIASPSFRELISSRLRYCLELLELPHDEVKRRLGTSTTFDQDSVRDFFKILLHSLFSKNRHIVTFIEALSFGNMREALEMFSTFLYSGATDVDKMLRISRREDEPYFVAFHEFAKSVIINDRRYYREAGKIINVFDRSSDPKGSHFTVLRILKYLVAHLSETHPEGRGFVALDEIMTVFIDAFDNEQDLTRQLRRLLAAQLIQADTRSTDTLQNVAYLRASSAGWYYLSTLVQSFVYLDLVLQDTPLTEEKLAVRIAQQIGEVDNLPDSHDAGARLSVRFSRVEAFLDYLARCEARERQEYDLDTKVGPLHTTFMDDIWHEYIRQRDWIRQRVTDFATADDADLPVTSESAKFEEIFSVSGDEQNDTGEAITEARER